MTWRTFFDAVIMTEVKRRRFACQRHRLSCRRVNVTGRVVHEVAVVRARAVRGSEHGQVVFTPWERALSLSQEGT